MNAECFKFFASYRMQLAKNVVLSIPLLARNNSQYKKRHFVNGITCAYVTGNPYACWDNIMYNIIAI